MDASGQAITLLQENPAGKPALDAFPMLLMAAGVMLLIVVLLNHLRKSVKRRSQRGVMQPSERIEAIHKDASGSSTLLERRMAQAADLSRELTAIIDNRSERLDVLVRHADERIERLERLLGEAQGVLPARPVSVNAGEASYANDTLKQQIYDLADRGEKPIEIAKRLGQHTGKVELILALRRA